jgi:hypothetical protein
LPPSPHGDCADSEPSVSVFAKQIIIGILNQQKHPATDQKNITIVLAPSNGLIIHGVRKPSQHQHERMPRRVLGIPKAIADHVLLLRKLTQRMRCGRKVPDAKIYS